MRGISSAWRDISDGASMAVNEIDGGLGNLKNMDLSGLTEHVERSVKSATSDLSSSLSKINNEMSDAVVSVKDMESSFDGKLSGMKNTLSDISRKASRSADDISTSADQISDSVQGSISHASRFFKSKMNSDTDSKKSKTTRPRPIPKFMERYSLAQNQTLNLLNGSYPLEENNKDLAYLNSGNWCEFNEYPYPYIYSGECKEDKEGATKIKHGRGVRFFMEEGYDSIEEVYFKDGKQTGTGRIIEYDGEFSISIYKEGKKVSTIYYKASGREYMRS